MNMNINNKLINYEEIDIINIEINDIVIIIDKKNELKYYKGYIIYIDLEDNIITLGDLTNSDYIDYNIDEYIIYKKMWDKNRKIKLIKDFQDCLESNNYKFIKKNIKKVVNKKKILLDFSLIEKLDL